MLNNNRDYIKRYLSALCGVTAIFYLVIMSLFNYMGSSGPKADGFSCFCIIMICYGLGAFITKTGFKLIDHYSLAKDFEPILIKRIYAFYIVVIGVFAFLCAFSSFNPLFATVLQVVVPMAIAQFCILKFYDGELVRRKEEAVKNEVSEQTKVRGYLEQLAAERKAREDKEPKEPEVLYRSVIPTNDNERRHYDTSFGTSQWLTDNQKENLTAVKNQEDKINTGLGLWLGGGFFNHKEGNLCSIAPPGKGKGAALIIPNLLWYRDYKHSFVVFDPKGTNACITAKFQQAIGQKVVLIDPMNLQALSGATHGIASSCFNPLDEIKDDIYNGSSIIVNLMLPDDPKGEKFWNQKARDFMQAVIMHIMTHFNYEDKRNLITFYKLIKTADFPVLFQEMIINDALNEEISHAAMEFGTMYTNSEKTFYSILSAVTGAINWLGNPAIQKVITKSDFRASELADGGTTVYLCQPINQKEQFATFSRLVVGTLLRINVTPSMRPKSWVYYLLDEFPSMGVFPEVVDSLALAREYKMRIWLFMQSISQLDDIYKAEGRHKILGNVGIMQGFGVSDRITQEYISQRLGDKTQSVNNSSTSSSDSRNVSHSDSWDDRGGSQSSQHNKSVNSTVTEGHSLNARKLLMPEEVERDPNIITLTEWGPMRLYRWQYWQPISNNIGSEYYNLLNDGRADRNPNI